jgi:hypothetical protein
VGHGYATIRKLKLGKRGPGPYHVAIIIIIVIRHNAAAAAGRTLLLVVSPLIDHASAAAVWACLRHVGLALSGTAAAQLAPHNPDRSGNGGRHGQWIDQPFRQQLHSGNKPNPPARFRCRQTRHKNLRRDREE